MCTAALCCEQHGANLSEKSVMCIIKGTDTITDTFAMDENELTAIYIYRLSDLLLCEWVLISFKIMWLNPRCQWNFPITVDVSSAGEYTFNVILLGLLLQPRTLLSAEAERIMKLWVARVASLQECLQGYCDCNSIVSTTVSFYSFIRHAISDSSQLILSFILQVRYSKWER